MMSISSVDSNQISAANKETITSAKTVHVKDILALRKALKYVKNQATTFNSDLKNTLFWRRPDVNSLKRMLTDLDSVGVRANQLIGQIKTSSYQHHASKMANLEKIKTTIDTLSKNASTSFYRSQKYMQVMREREDKYLYPSSLKMLDFSSNEDNSSNYES